MSFDFKRVSFFYISLTMVLVPLLEFVQNCFGETLTYHVWFLHIAGFIGAAIALFYIVDNRKKGIAELFYLLLILLYCISTIFSEDNTLIQVSFEFSETLGHYLAYYTLFYMSASLYGDKECDRYRDDILKVFIFVASFNVIPALLQIFRIYPIDCVSHTERHVEHAMVFGLTRHSNYYAVLSIIFIACILGILMFNELSKKKKVLLYLLLFISVLCSLHTFARIAWVGLTTLLLFYVIYLIVAKQKNVVFVNENFKRIITCLIIFVVISVFWLVVLDLKTGEISEDYNNMVTVDVSSTENFANFRGFLWITSLKSVPTHWWHGVGPDNFRWLLYERYISGEEIWLNAHNLFMHVLATQGIFAMITYIALIVVATIKTIKNIHINNPMYLSIVAGYVASCMFIWAVSSVSIYYWIALGLCLAVTNKKSINT
ncbi:MAG: O-antigen ligase family protein [Saccharofermentans sp.]|nr:O-antigen ligase family protein [Saccharofermentans sp.]